MPVNRPLCKAPLRKSGAPAWACPTCGAGHFRLMPDSVAVAWNAATHAASSHDAFYSWCVTSKFTAILVCDNPACKEAAGVSGRGSVSEEPNQQMTEIEYVDVLFPEYFRPSPNLINIPPRCPAPVKALLELAFTASWGDYASAAHHLRSAVEGTLTALGVRRTQTRNHRRTPLTLHARIQLLDAKYASSSRELLALKILGNAGSHPGVLTQEDVFDALDIFETVLANLFSTEAARVNRLVAAVNSRRAPLRRPRTT